MDFKQFAGKFNPFKGAFSKGHDALDELKKCIQTGGEVKALTDSSAKKVLRTLKNAQKKMESKPKAKGLQSYKERIKQLQKDTVYGSLFQLLTEGKHEKTTTVDLTKGTSENVDLKKMAESDYERMQTSYGTNQASIPSQINKAKKKLDTLRQAQKCCKNPTEENIKILQELSNSDEDNVFSSTEKDQIENAKELKNLVEGFNTKIGLAKTNLKRLENEPIVSFPIKIIASKADEIRKETATDADTASLSSISSDDENPLKNMQDFEDTIKSIVEKNKYSIALDNLKLALSQNATGIGGDTVKLKTKQTQGHSQMEYEIRVEEESITVSGKTTIEGYTDFTGQDPSRSPVIPVKYQFSLELPLDKEVESLTIKEVFQRID